MSSDSSAAKLKFSTPSAVVRACFRVSSRSSSGILISSRVTISGCGRGTLDSSSLIQVHCSSQVSSMLQKLSYSELTEKKSGELEDAIAWHSKSSELLEILIASCCNGAVPLLLDM